MIVYGPGSIDFTSKTRLIEERVGADDGEVGAHQAHRRLVERVDAFPGHLRAQLSKAPRGAVVAGVAHQKTQVVSVGSATRPPRRRTSAAAARTSGRAL